MEPTEQVLAWAEDHVEKLTQEMYWDDGGPYGSGYWKAMPTEAETRIRARVTAACAFLDQFTGTGSRWSEDASVVFKDDRRSMESGARAVGDVINEWIRMVRSGQAKPKLVEAFSARAASSTDLLEQVRVLNEDRSITPAAPIVLAGAALEVALRAAIDELEIPVTGRSINAYAEALRQADVLNRQHIKVITQMAGLRNDAAHGRHDDLAREGALLMEQHVNYFLDQLDQAVQQSS